MTAGNLSVHIQLWESAEPGRELIIMRLSIFMPESLCEPHLIGFHKITYLSLCIQACLFEEKRKIVHCINVSLEKKSQNLLRRVFCTKSAPNTRDKTSDNYLIQHMLEWYILCFEDWFFKVLIYSPCGHCLKSCFVGLCISALLTPPLNCVVLELLSSCRDYRHCKETDSRSPW